MLKIQENKNLKKFESSVQKINEDWKKYNKRLDGMLDNALFSNKLDNKKLRAKNPKIAIISLVSLALLIIIFVQNKQNLDLFQSVANEEPSSKTKLLVAEDELAKNSTGKTESKQKHSNIKRNKKVKTSQILKAYEGPVNLLKEKPPSISQAKSKKQIIPSRDKFYFIQVGAFSIKDNANKLAKKINSKGFQTKIFIKKIKMQGVKSDTKLVETDGKAYIVLAKNLATERKAQQAKKTLINLGFKNSFIRYQ